MIAHYLLLILVLLSGAAFSIRTKKLTVTAAITGIITGLLVFLGAGFTGIVMMTVFFLLGSFATSHHLNAKRAAGLAEQNKGRRTATQVIANAGIAAIIGLLAFLIPDQSKLFNLMMAAAFASATSDTLSSELGNVYGKRFYNIISLKPDQKGLDGVISLEGSLFGIAGSLIIAVIFSIKFGWINLIPVMVAGIAGNVADSLFGATLERKGVLDNNAVNLLNTTVAATTGAVFNFLLIG